jgi:hypothetical protein
MVRHKEASRLAHIASLEATGDPTLVAFYHSNATAEGSAFLEAKPKSYSLCFNDVSSDSVLQCVLTTCVVIVRVGLL